MISLLLISFMSYSDVGPIIQNRCALCHDAGNPEGLDWTKEANVKAHKDHMIQKLTDKEMPPSNVTNMTDAERAKLIKYLKQL